MDVSNTYNDNDSIDFNFFDSLDRQTHIKNRSQIVTKAIIETPPMSNPFTNVAKSIKGKPNNILNRCELSISKTEPDFAFNFLINSVTNIALEESSSNNLACSDKSNTTVSNSPDGKEHSDYSSSESSTSTISSDLTSVTPCSLISDSSLAYEESEAPSSTLIDDGIVQTNLKLKYEHRIDLNTNIIKCGRCNDIQNNNLCENDVQPLESTCKDKKQHNPEVDSGFEKESSNIVSIGEEFENVTLSGQYSTSGLQKVSLLGKSQSKTRIRRTKSNLTFNNEELRKIERENLILLKKIMAHSKPRPIVMNQTFTHKKTSGAINRARQQEKIQQDNYVSIFVETLHKLAIHTYLINSGRVFTQKFPSVKLLDQSK